VETPAIGTEVGVGEAAKTGEGIKLTKNNKRKNIDRLLCFGKINFIAPFLRFFGYFNR
jgi:hypothetical protein